jgi:uncharacterized protein YdhG (YjbR/CyaY superfamily)
MTQPNDIDSYISGFPEQTRGMLEQLRATIKLAAPEASEVISYGMPAYKQNGILVYFAAYKNHIGFYPTASGIENFKKDFSAFHLSKGTIRFPLDQPLPLELIARVVKFRVEDRLLKVALKQSIKK